MGLPGKITTGVSVRFFIFSTSLSTDEETMLPPTNKKSIFFKLQCFAIAFKLFSDILSGSINTARSEFELVFIF